MGRTKKTYIEKLGLAPVDGKLTPKICRERSRKLAAAIEADKYEGRLLEQARYYRGWYAWRAKNSRDAESIAARKKAKRGARKKAA